MSPAKRIVLNTLASYGRTLFGMALGLFSSRWVLNGLGKDDFGLFGVVGGIITFVGLLNALLANSVGRYYAYAIGESKNMSEADARENLMRWFNSALSIHWILPVVLVAIGYPIGVYAIRHWLVIPDGRLEACIWVFRLSLFMAFMNMVSVPYIAMYQAKQLIAELSLWGVVTTVANFLIAFYMLYCPLDRFVMFACLSAIVPSLILGIQICRARKHFGVCHVRLEYLFDKLRLAKIFNFAFWDFFGWLGGTVRDQGAVFVLNRNFGSGLNAAYRIAQSVINYTTSLSAAIIGALQPAITTAVGQSKIAEARALAYRASKFSPLMILFFAIPVIVEIDELLRLWLVNPPEYTAGFCRAILIATVAIKLGWGHHMAVCALGRIAIFQMALGLTACCSLIVLVVLIACGCGPLSVGYMFIAIYSIMTFERVLFARKLMGMSVRYWLLRIVVPILIVAMLVGTLAYGFTKFFDQSFLRVCGTASVSSVLLGCMAWVLVLDSAEREYVLVRFRSRFGDKKRREVST